MAISKRCIHSICLFIAIYGLFNSVAYAAVTRQDVLTTLIKKLYDASPADRDRALGQMKEMIEDGRMSIGELIDASVIYGHERSRQSGQDNFFNRLAQSLAKFGESQAIASRQSNRYLIKDAQGGAVGSVEQERY